MKLLDATVGDAICRAIASGASVRDAAGAAGVSKSSFFLWMSKGKSRRRADAAYRQFRKAVVAARHKMVTKRLERLERAAESGAWQADAWVLERVRPSRFARPSDRARLAKASEPPPLAEAYQADAGTPQDRAQFELDEARRRVQELEQQLSGDIDQ